MQQREKVATTTTATTISMATTQKHFNLTFSDSRNRPFSYSENECGSNDISLQFVEFSNVDNCDRSVNATLSNLEYKIV